MKFLTPDDKLIYELELNNSKINEDDFIKRRGELISKIKDFRRSQTQKSNWRENRWKYLKAIRRYHNSTAGKKFHKELGRFLATKDLSGLSYSESKELVKPLMSMLVHAYIEYDYFMPLIEQVDYEILTEYMYDEVLNILIALREYPVSLLEHYEFLIRITETNALIKSFSDKSGKSEKEIEDMWNLVKKSLIDQGHKEDDDNFYSMLVGILKKNLSI